MSEYSVNRCSKCGRQLTMEEDAAFHPPTCMSCAREHVSTIKTEMIKNIAISVVLMIVGIVVIKNPAGVLLAGIPYGWSFLNKITPAMFVWMSWIGWAVYFLVKLMVLNHERLERKRALERGVAIQLSYSIAPSGNFSWNSPTNWILFKLSNK